jgi:hypothetical protein
VGDVDLDPRSLVGWGENGGRGRAEGDDEIIDEKSVNLDSTKETPQRGLGEGDWKKCHWGANGTKQLEDLQTTRFPIPIPALSTKASTGAI